MPDTPVPYERKEVVTQAADGLLQAQLIEVNSHESAHKAREIRRMEKILDKVAEAHYKLMKKPWDEGKKKIMEQEESDREPMALAMELLDPKILAWEEEEDRRRLAFQEKLTRDALERAKASRDEMIARFEAAGNQKAADDLRQEPLYVPPVVIPEPWDYLPGEGRLESWGVEQETIDLMELAKAVVEGKLPLGLIAPNVPALNKMATALKETFNIPGCKARKKRSITQR